jgi:hypothetical protein
LAWQLHHEFDLKQAHSLLKALIIQGQAEPNRMIICCIIEVLQCKVLRLL